VPDVFDVSDEPFRTIILDAAYELGVFDGTARNSRRMRMLLDALASFGMLAERPPRPPGGAFVREGWGTLAEVIAKDRPVATPSEGGTRAMHEHLARTGAAAAEETAALLCLRPDLHLVDLGGGAGAYTAALLRAAPGARATIVDAPHILDLARVHLADYGDRVSYVAGDIRDVAVGDADVALLANVLHLHGPATCAELCWAAARWLQRDGMLVIKDLRMDVDADGMRSGPRQSLLFALTMAIYTDEGDVYETSRLVDWLHASQLVNVETRRLESSPTSIVVSGRKS